jgi:hypothetical protein
MVMPQRFTAGRYDRVAITGRAPENIVRGPLKKEQSQFAPLLESLEAELPYPHMPEPGSGVISGLPDVGVRNLIVVRAAACGCVARPRWCRPRHQHHRCPMPTADTVRTPSTFGISAWLHRSEAMRPPMCRWERTGRDPCRDRRRDHAIPGPRCPVAAGEGPGSCDSSGHRHLSSWWACAAAARRSHPVAIRVFRAAGRRPSWLTSILGPC